MSYERWRGKKMGILDNLEKQIEARDAPTPKPTTMPVMDFFIERWEARAMRIRRFGARMRAQDQELQQVGKLDLHDLLERDMR